MTMTNLEMSLEPLQPLNLLVPVLPYHQEPAANSQGPTVLDNSADEDREYSDEYSAQSHDSQRTFYVTQISTS